MDWISGADGAVLRSLKGAHHGLRSCPAGIIDVAGLWWCGVAANRMEDLMANSPKKSALARSQEPVSAAKPLVTGKQARPAKPTSAASERPAATKSDNPAETLNLESKQARVLSMLRSPTGATIAAMMQATGWQQHSVRGFLAGVVRKRLKLKLMSKKVDSTRVYRIAVGAAANTHSRQVKRRAA